MTANLRYSLLRPFRPVDSFRVAGSEHAELVYDDAEILLTMAIADNVLVDFRSETDLLES